MNKIINETEVIANKYLIDFGFSESQISTLLKQGKKDLHKELSKFEVLCLHADSVALEDINNSLHALKGLFLQLGNHKVAEKLNELTLEDERKSILHEIMELLFFEK